MMEIIFATHNEHKCLELKKLFEEYNIKIISLSELNYFEEIEENGSTLVENAHIKAKKIHEIFKKPVIADDSGIFVDALRKELGVHSKRYSISLKDEDNNLKLLKNLENKDERNAYFLSVLVLILNEGTIYISEGKMSGKIGKIPVGENGFGYDPLFIPAGYEITYAQMTNNEKNKISHRSKAFEGLIEYFKEFK